MSSESFEDLPTRICLWSQDDQVNDELLAVAKSFKVPVTSNFKEFGSNFGNDDYDTIFILHQFDGPEFDIIKNHRRVLGPTALRELSMREEALPNNKHPLYCLSMVGVVICFSGFRDKTRLRNLIYMVHYMGGSVRNHVSKSTTHLVSRTSLSQSYRLARVYGIPIMAEEWVTQCWDCRDQLNMSALAPDKISLSMKTFASAFICFYGFSPEERSNIEDIAKEFGAIVVTLQDPKLTHVVFDECYISSIPGDVPLDVYTVTSFWFWTSVKENSIATEDCFLVKKSPGTTSSSCQIPKRKYSVRHKKPKKTSAVIDESWTSNCSTEKFEITENNSNPDLTSHASGRSRRLDVFEELLRTETNYVRILLTLLEVKKELLNENQLGGPILKIPEANVIFTNLEAIYETHCQLVHELELIGNSWSDHSTVGHIFTQFGPDLRKEYPAFVNYFESSRQMLSECNKTNSRFHAFLKVCKSRPQFHRQSLQDLMIRPIQRLASTALILSELKKRTESSHPDYSALELAIRDLNDTVAMIDEEKKNSETFSYMFEIFNLIQDCPANLLSARRTLHFQFEAQELKYPGLGKPGERLMVFVFGDIIEVCKVRLKVMRLGTAATHQEVMAISNGHPYKHLAAIPIEHIRRVTDIKDNSYVVNAISLHVRRNCEIEEKTYPLQLLGKTCSKRDILDFFVNTIKSEIGSKVLLEKTLEEEGIRTQSLGSLTSPINKALSFAYQSAFRVRTAFGLHRESVGNISTQISRTGSLSMQALQTDTTQMEVMQAAAGGAKSISLTEKLMKRL